VTPPHSSIARAAIRSPVPSHPSPTLSPVVSQAPLSPAAVLAKYSSFLTPYETSEILNYPEIYYVGVPTAKLQQTSTAKHNLGFDIGSHHYKATARDHIAYRYEIQSMFGRGAFGQVLKCYDHKTKQFVALKILVNTPQMSVQGRAEISFLAALNSADTSGDSAILHLLDTFDFRGHVCGVFEVLGQNLYEYTRTSGFRSVRLADVRRIAREILRALAFTHSHGIVHCDMKPENILIVPDEVPVSVRVIDYGSACRIGQKHYAYIQSRFYRAPEVILGIDYGPPMDIWSFACIIAELVAGRPLFPGDTEAAVLRAQIEVLGEPPWEIVGTAPRAGLFFGIDGSLGDPVGRSSLEQETKIQDPALIDLLTRCLEWDQEKRMTAEQALAHAFFAQEEKVRKGPSAKRRLKVSSSGPIRWSGLS
jgi:dual specificity tyrosine-phosphorylation-regulated kinase 2/3/4